MQRKYKNENVTKNNANEQPNASTTNPAAVPPPPTKLVIERFTICSFEWWRGDELGTCC